MNALEKTRQADKKLDCMQFIPEKLGPAKSGPLSNTVIAVKDNLCVQGMPARAGSKILEGYVPPFTATCVQRLIDQGAVVAGKTVMDEFGFGTFNVNTEKIPKNPHDALRCTGGSSGGSAAFTAFTGMPSVAESTGGSITAPAAFCGVVGLTPTYGRVSRWGLIDYANSLDKIGVMATTVQDAFRLLYAMAGPDEKDATTTKPFPEKKRTNQIALLTTIWEKTDASIQKQCQKAAGQLQAQGVAVEEAPFPLADPGLYAYYVLAMSEASTNLAKYCGLRYGIQPKPEESETYTEYFSRVRAQGFGAEAKRRLILGSFARTAGYRGKYYEKAAKVRTLVIREFKKLFEKYDALITPSMPCVAPRFREIERLSPLEHYAMDICTGAPNLAGLPHASIPCGRVSGLPVGLQIITNHFQEKTLSDVARQVEQPHE
ncbi:Asp-tRNA(Asn)/Glu-tRNA(Gln) amidotransferase subunit GatA [Candidatus Micrarchaeota archaeon]|nr:Asp-tRNA(Asn)/Glu-tRNA(Gln) amidotransferase subunit GatA [Candidatus Micrarchaeota archaeon]